jgi:hypothetical protein
LEQSRLGATVILADLVLPTRTNQFWTTSGLDSIDKCFNKQHFLDYPYKVEYQYNSRGFRDSEWPESQSELKDAVWCVGDSFTVGIGSPYNFTWPQVLSAATGRRCINISMEGASNTWISRRAQQIVNEVEPTHMVVMWSYIHRREHPDTSWSDESRRLYFKNLETDIDDLTDFVNCYQQLNTAAVSTNIFNSIIPKYMWIPNCWDIWANIRDATWPVKCPQRRLEFSALPEYIQQELFSRHHQDVKEKFELLFAHTEFLDHHDLLQLTNLDYARDYHHFDNVTSKFLVEKICKTLFPGDHGS